MRILLSVSIRKWLLSTGLQRMAGSWMTTAAVLILPLSSNVMSAAWMKLRFRSSCPDIISGRPQAARSLRRKRSCRENSAAGVGPGAGNSDLSGKTALLRTTCWFWTTYPENTHFLRTNFWVGGAAHLLLSEISFAVAPTSRINVKSRLICILQCARRIDKSSSDAVQDILLSMDSQSAA